MFLKTGDRCFESKTKLPIINSGVCLTVGFVGFRSSTQPTVNVFKNRRSLF
ncbi:hypothetical protein [Cylindrospermopsis raciborskii]|uniref:hypothetical protein n=1 Tax=Cylindrospermopsis raciborskii TaxID=77022 RepID=UPI000A7A511D|nr:hypothetical protein [Cylindrospermopsis raciborskii]